MDAVQKSICRELLAQSYRQGFECSYPVEPVAAKLNLTVQDIFDENTGTGLLYEYSAYGNGMLHFSNGGRNASVSMDTKDQLAHWCDFKGI